MLNTRLWLRPLRFSVIALLLLTLLPWACTRKTVSFNTTPEPPPVVMVADTLTHIGDSLKGKPSLSTARKVVLTKEEERAAKEKEKAAQRKSKKKKKKLFLGERTKKAFVKSGAKGRNQVIEIFYYLRYFQQPNPYAPARYYYNSKKHKIFKATGEITPDMKILHGPYKKMQNNKVLEIGYYALGTRHLRWERMDKNGILLSKTHYEMGFPRDANISYYGNDRSLINEVVPYVNGKLEGDYAKFTIEGQREWTGQFENGHKVGEWTNYWGFRNRKRYIYQYPESGYDPEVEEPELVKEYNRNAILIYDKETGLDKRGMTEQEQAPKGRAVPKAPAKVQPKRAKP